VTSSEDPTIGTKQRIRHAFYVTREVVSGVYRVRRESKDESSSVDEGQYQQAHGRSNRSRGPRHYPPDYVRGAFAATNDEAYAQQDEERV
jgi:hypothetical protein